MPRRKDPAPTPPPPAEPVLPDADAFDGVAEDAEAPIVPVEAVIDIDADDDDTDVDEIVPAVVVAAAEIDVDDADEDLTPDVEDEAEAEVVVVAPAARPARPSPGRPPSAKEEPDPPFFLNERIKLVKNTRPRTGAPIGIYPVGAEGRVVTVLSNTCIVQFDLAPDTKEVVAFECVDSLDPAAVAARAERDRLKAQA